LRSYYLGWASLVVIINFICGFNVFFLTPYLMIWKESNEGFIILITSVIVVCVIDFFALKANNGSDTAKHLLITMILPFLLSLFIAVCCFLVDKVVYLVVNW